MRYINVITITINWPKRGRATEQAMSGFLVLTGYTLSLFSLFKTGYLSGDFSQEMLNRDMCRDLTRCSRCAIQQNRTKLKGNDIILVLN